MPEEGLDLDSGEQVLRRWKVEPVSAEGGVGRFGWLVLTPRRVLFHPMRGLLGSGRARGAPLFARSLEDIRSVSTHREYLRIGYGDRIEMPGLSIDGARFRLVRGASAEEVRASIERAQQDLRSSVRGTPAEKADERATSGSAPGPP